MARPTFIVGTGRCGSTLLSNLINQHPKILSLSEFFSLVSDLGGQTEKLFHSTPISASDFWNLIGSSAPRSAFMVRAGIAMPEVIYPYNSPSARFSAQAGVPVILQCTLPHLTSACDSLYDEVAEFTCGRPTAPITEHYLALFDFLKHRSGRNCWIERSGASSIFLEQLQQFFPDARFIHIVRDGRNVALSMNKHSGFRMFAMGQLLMSGLKVDPFYSDNRDLLRRVPRQFRNFLPESFDAEAYRNFRFPIQMMGELWSQQIIAGLKVLDRVPIDQQITLCYEDLLRSPEKTLLRLLTFLGADFIDEAWIQSACKQIGRPESNFSSLSDAEEKALRNACQKGFAALNASGIAYPDAD